MKVRAGEQRRGGLLGVGGFMFWGFRGERVGGGWGKRHTRRCRVWGGSGDCRGEEGLHGGGGVMSYEL